MNKTVKYLIYVLLIGTALYLFLIRPYLITKKLDRNHDYVKGKIIRKESAVEGSDLYIYEYSVNGKSYSGSFGYDTRFPVNIGECYWIKYYRPDPDINEIEQNRPVECEE